MPRAKKDNSDVALTVVVTAHAEGILLHRTLTSVRVALEQLKQSTEILIHCDNPTKPTLDYLKANKAFLADTRIYTNAFGDLGSSRNYAVRKANGKYVTFIDADDLMSKYWLAHAYKFLESKELGLYVAHSETTVEFGGMNAVVIKHGEIDKTSDTLLSVYSNRWNSIIMAPRELLLEESYTKNNPGYGYEDWHLNCRFIARGIHNVLIPETAIFVRRKSSDSEWLRQKQSRAVLPKNVLFDFGAIRSLQNPFQTSPRAQGIKNHIKELARPFVKKYPYMGHVGARVYRRVMSLGHQSAHHLPEWLLDDWRAMHDIDREVFLSEQMRLHTPFYDSLTPEHFQTASAFKSLVDHTQHDTYDYLLFVPWLKHGGADSFAINYANEIFRQNPQAHIAVIATLPADSPWSDKLTKGIDFIPFGSITDGMSTEIRYRLLEQFIENGAVQYLHIVNSELAYDFVESHATYIRHSDKKVIATSFSQSTDSTGRVFGYSHTHVPKVYDLLSTITSDNRAVVAMWQQEYGFDQQKMLVHRQPVDVSLFTHEPHTFDGTLHLLWAARLSPEKQPQLVAEIGHLLADLPVLIDMYGSVDTDFDATFLKDLPPNVTYKGAFSGFQTLPLSDYDSYLYTSLFDGMPNAVLEAAAARLPIISSAVGGVPDFINDKVNGRLVRNLPSANDYAEAIKDFLSDPKTLKAYRDISYDKVLNDYSLSAYQKQVKQFLISIDFKV